MRLVDDDVFEAKFLECALLDEAYFVGRDADLEVLGDQAIGNDFCALLFAAGEDDDAEVRGPLLKFAGPILESGFWNNNKVWPGRIRLMLQVSKKRDRLESFSETLQDIFRLIKSNTRQDKEKPYHFISEDTVQTVVM